MGRQDATKYKSAAPYILISFRDPSSPALVPTEDPNRIASYFLEASDADGDELRQVFSGPIVEFTDTIADNLVAFVAQHLAKVHHIVVNCEVGFCRSPAFAAAIHTTFFGARTDERFFREYRPNTTVYRKTFEACQRWEEANNKKLSTLITKEVEMTKEEITAKISARRREYNEKQAKRQAEHAAFVATKVPELKALRTSNAELFKLADAQGTTIQTMRLVPAQGEKAENGIFKPVFCDRDRMSLAKLGPVTNDELVYESLMEAYPRVDYAITRALANKPVYITIALAMRGPTVKSYAYSICIAEDAKNRIKGEIKTTGLNIALQRLLGTEEKK